MKTYQLVILGPQTAGKTTLTKYLRLNEPDLPVLEEEEIFMKLNGGEYPHDHEYKEKVMRPKLDAVVAKLDNLIFLSSYADFKLLRELKKNGFKIIQLTLGDEEFERRNEKRMREEKYSDAREWKDDLFRFHQDLALSGLVDKSIDAALPTEEIAREVLKF